ncbi:FtsX-like permease family protein [Escherichia coli]
MSCKTETVYYYLTEALLNIFENKKQNLAFMLFLSLSFVGIIITDSLIYSVSLKAENELQVYGDKVMHVKLNQPKTTEKIMRIFETISNDISFSKQSFFYVGSSPFSGDSLPVTGIDELGLGMSNIKFLDDKFYGNVAIVNDIGIFGKSKQVFINGIPFKIIGVIYTSNTDFLDSLGLSSNLYNEQIYVPLKTMFRLKMSNEIDSFKLLLNKNITFESINEVREILYNNKIRDFNIITSLNAKETVERVLKRFSLLTNSVYIILTFSAVVTCFMLSKRNFYSRSTEIALKIIHGVKQGEIILMVLTESFIILFICLVLSISSGYTAMYVITKILDVDISRRMTMITISLSTILMAFIISNVIFGKLFFNMNPVNVIKGRIE